MLTFFNLMLANFQACVGTYLSSLTHILPMMRKRNSYFHIILTTYKLS